MYLRKTERLRPKPEPRFSAARFGLDCSPWCGKKPLPPIEKPYTEKPKRSKDRLHKR